jgi:hypothetical protein
MQIYIIIPSACADHGRTVDSVAMAPEGLIQEGWKLKAIGKNFDLPHMVLVVHGTSYSTSDIGARQSLPGKAEQVTHPQPGRMRTA